MAVDAFLIFRTTDLTLITETGDPVFGNLSGRAVTQVKSFSLGAAISTPSGPGAGAGRVTYNGLSFTKNASINSPTLLGLCNTGRELSQVTLALRHSNGGASSASSVFAVYTFGAVIVNSYSSDGSFGDDAPTDTLHLLAGQYALNTYAVAQNGTVFHMASGWDVIRNVSWAPSVIDSPHP